MASLHTHNDATDDLEELWDEEPQAAARITAFLEELESNQDLLDRLTQHNFGAYHLEDFHVSKWFEHWNKGQDIWRLKIWDLEDVGLKYRIIYAFLPNNHQHHVLAIVHRDFDYETDHPITQRILEAYQQL